MPVCQSDHRYLPSLEGLPDSQAGAGRHRCAGCAYEQGYDDGLARIHRKEVAEPTGQGMRGESKRR